ncbi:MAG: TonB-dependent receptor plug domain-containing protein [Hymenobacter sp.]
MVTGRSAEANISKAQSGGRNAGYEADSQGAGALWREGRYQNADLTAGHQNGGGGQQRLSVRGGAVDQNLILLDEAPVYNASHLLGFFSTFNSDAVKDVTVYEGRDAGAVRRAARRWWTCG